MVKRKTAYHCAMVDTREKSPAFQRLPILFAVYPRRETRAAVAEEKYGAQTECAGTVAP